MQTIIATVGTSLLTNRDADLPEGQRRPWAGQGHCPDEAAALEWMAHADVERISAETNTLWRLDPLLEDRLVLLHSDTESGMGCARILQAYLARVVGQKNVELVLLPGIHYEMDGQPPALARMSEQLEQLIDGAEGSVTFAATGGFKAEVMQMAVVGHKHGIPVCYVHEQFRVLIYLPASEEGEKKARQRVVEAGLPVSNRPREQVVQIQRSTQHHRPRGWEKVVSMIQEIPWVDSVRVDDAARHGIRNGVKAAPRGAPDGRHVFWVVLYDGKAPDLPLVVETTGSTPAQMETAASYLRQCLGRIF